MEIVERLLNGDRRAAAKLITLVENNASEIKEIMNFLYPHTGHAYIIGITGAPGSGKSTLVDRLTVELRKKDKTVGIIAIDPTSPFTGGALLGDRIRMQERSTDKGVFIRSMGTRGSLGGLAKATNDVVSILDAFGKDYIIVETVGAGQSEVDIVNLAHTSIVVLVPGMGDEIQAIKAGILEIGDIFVINKADREGVEKTVMEIEMMLDLSEKKEGWKPPVLKTVATTNEGVPELLDAIEKHRRYLESTDAIEKKRWERGEAKVMEILKEEITNHLTEKIKEDGKFEELIKKVVSREMDPYSAAEEILEPILRSNSKK
ncbi:MAG: methylmalonyl Co-A mutase-associated GTPase MeaB [Candidatus Syntropharchaeia archaeon]